MTRRRRAGRVLVAGSLAALALAVPAQVATATDATTVDDVSAAVRYEGAGATRQVIGEPLADLFDEDDAGQTKELPFPINFFGQKYTHLCVTNNGAVFPTNDPTQSSCTEYDYGLGELAIYAEAPIMAVLALDLDASEDLLTADGRNVSDLWGPIDGTNETAVLSGGVVTVTYSRHELVAGDHAAFVGTGTVLDSVGTLPVTVIDANNFSVPVPGITDLDLATPGVQTGVTTGNWTYANSVGVPRGIYFGTTTVDGRDAVAVTWYRTAHNDDYNPWDRSATIQLVLVQGTTGDNTVGWDFAVEYNIGTMTDDEDGYDVSDSTSSCTAWGSAWSDQDNPSIALPPAPTDDQRSTCRWAMGFGSYSGGIVLESVTISAGTAILTTSGPHGVTQSAGGLGVRLELPPDPGLGDLSGEWVWADVSSATTFTVTTSASPTASAFSPGSLTFNASDVYELFSTSSIDALIDSAGATALVQNSLNSNVLGRYRWEMIGGLVQSFGQPVMSGTPTIVNAAIVDNPPTTTLPPSAAQVLPPPPSSVAPSTTVAPSTSVPSTTRPPSTSVAPSSSVPAPVPDGGVLPELVPGVSQVITDGVATNVEVFVDNSTDLVLRGQDFELRLAGECTNGCTIDTTSDGRQVLTLEERGLASVSGEGFSPGTPVYVWLFSEPRFLGELTVNADGTFAGSVALGDIEVGEHTLQVNGTSFDGKPRTANLGVVVNPGEVPAPAPGPGVLPATGSDGTPVALLALLLLGVGVIFLGRRPLRSRQEAAQ